MPSYGEISHACDELHNDMSSPCMKCKTLKLKLSSLSKEVKRNRDIKRQ